MAYELKAIPTAHELEIKKDFIEKYSKLTDFEEFKKYSLSFLRKSIRINTLKISVDELKSRLKDSWTLTQIPWCKEGFYIEGERRDVGNLPEHSLGYIYVQEAASMIPPLVLNPNPGELVLDMCAAPGSKTTQLAQYMENKGMIVANDIMGDRLAALGINLQRCGVSNCIITQMHGSGFKNILFDKILVDAPCSGTGTIRKSLGTLRMWNINTGKNLAMTQKKLIKTAFNVLKPGGTLVYSTCTLEPEEDEGVIDYLLNEFPNAHVEEIDLNIKKSKAVLEYNGQSFNKEVSKCLRLWPQDNDTEGFFVAKITKR